MIFHHGPLLGMDRPPPRWLNHLRLPRKSDFRAVLMELHRINSWLFTKLFTGNFIEITFLLLTRNEDTPIV